MVEDPRCHLILQRRSDETGVGTYHRRVSGNEFVVDDAPGVRLIHSVGQRRTGVSDEGPGIVIAQDDDSFGHRSETLRPPAGGSRGGVQVWSTVGPLRSGRTARLGVSSDQGLSCTPNPSAEKSAGRTLRTSPYLSRRAVAILETDHVAHSQGRVVMFNCPPSSTPSRGGALSATAVRIAECRCCLLGLDLCRTGSRSSRRSCGERPPSTLSPR